MAIEAMSWVWKHSEQKNTKLLMILAIADQCNDEGFCWPRVGKLGTKVRLETYNAALRMIAQLEATGELDHVARPGRSSYYYLPKYCEHAGIDLVELIDKLQDLAEHGHNQMVRGKRKKADIDPPPDGDDTPHQTDIDPPPDGDDTPHQTDIDPPPDGGPEPSVNHHLESSNESSHQPSSPTTHPDDDDGLNKKSKNEQKIPSVVIEVFGNAKNPKMLELMKHDRDLTISWCRYAPDFPPTVKNPPGLIYSKVMADENPPKVIEESFEERMAREAKEREEKIASMTPEELVLFRAKEAAEEKRREKRRDDEFNARIAAEKAKKIERKVQARTKKLAAARKRCQNMSVTVTQKRHEQIERHHVEALRIEAKLLAARERAAAEEKARQDAIDRAVAFEELNSDGISTHIMSQWTYACERQKHPPCDMQSEFKLVDGGVGKKYAIVVYGKDGKTLGHERSTIIRRGELADDFYKFTFVDALEYHQRLAKKNGVDHAG